MANLSGITIVFSPLLSLMTDQVGSASFWDVKLCAISCETMKASPRLTRDVARRDYQLVLMQPEFCSRSNADFICMTGEDTALRSRIIGIVVDEAHFTHSWRSFRVQWGSIGAIRPFFPGVPIMTLSATVTPYV